MVNNNAGGRSFLRDKDYYFSDGSCLFLVEDRVLFKIHRSRLEANSVVFRVLLSRPDMFKSLGGHQQWPIVVHDTVQEFRALCWALYADPSKIDAQMTPEKVNIPRIINIISMAQKYAFKDLRDWAFSVFDTHLRRSRLQCPDWTVIDNILTTAYANGQKNLALQIEQLWLRSIMASPQEGNCFVKALDIAERLNLRQFHGKIYLCYLQAIGKFDPSPNDDALVHIGTAASLIEKGPICDLDDRRKVRLYHGFLSLTQLRNSLDRAPPLSDNPQCKKHTDCQRGWERWWSDFLRKIQPSRSERLHDPDEFFWKLEKWIMKYPVLVPSETRPVRCQALIKTQVRAMKKQFEHALADHFMIPEVRR